MSNNKVKTQPKVPTHEDVLKYEAGMIKRGKQRQQKNRKRQQRGNTSSAQAYKEKILSRVRQNLEKIIQHGAVRKGGPEPVWLSLYQKAAEADLDQVADLAISIVFEATHNNWTEGYLQLMAGQAFENYAFEMFMRRNQQGRRMLDRLQKQVVTSNKTFERRSDHIMRKAEQWGWKSEWTDGHKAAHGNILWLAVEMLGDFATIELRQPDGAKFAHPANFVVLTPEAEAELDADDEKADELRPSFEPMNIRPNDWNPDNLGPYRTPELARGVPFIKNATKAQQEHIYNGLRDGSCSELAEVLDYLQSVPLVLNEYVISALNWVKDDRAVRSQIKKFPAVTNPDDVKPERPFRKDHEHLNTAEWVEVYRGYMDDRELAADAKANRREINRHLRSARRVRKFITDKGLVAFNPHDYDNRGRVYHVPDFGIQKADYTRAMFLFARKTPITEENEAYLHLQLANTFGVDKESIDFRMAWVAKNLRAIKKAGKDFKSTIAFWGQASDPFQFLAACRAYFEYKSHDDSAGPYLCGLPVAFDATQSGIQIMAAAALNEVDGKRVNLCASTPSDAPGDMYKAVLAEAKDVIRKEHKKLLGKVETDPFTDDELADLDEYNFQMADDNINEPDKFAIREAFKKTKAYSKFQRAKDIESAEQVMKLFDLPKSQVKGNADYGRSVIKRSVMTYGYSSRQFGFAQQLRKDWMKPLTRDVKDGILAEHPFGADKGYHAAHFLGRMHQKAIENVVASVRDGMKFMQDCCSALVDENAHMRFLTPMNFLMEQDYRESSTHKHKLLGWDRETRVFKNSERNYKVFKDKVKRKDSIQAIAPNLIHALDATLLQKTVLLCKDNNVNDMMVIHDSFATTIGNAATLSEAVRVSFVDLFGGGYCFYTDLRDQVMEQLRDAKPAYLHQLLDQLWAELPEDDQDKVATDFSEMRDTLDMVTCRDRTHAEAAPDLLQQFETLREKLGDKAKLSSKDKETAKIRKAVKAIRGKVMTFDQLVLPDVPAKGNLDIKDVINSEYFFS